MIRRVPARRAFCILLLAAGCVAAGARTAAHELERTRVSLAFQPDGRFVLDIANDPQWLLLRLEPFLPDYPEIPGRAGDAGLAPAERDARLAALGPVMRDRFVLFVDGREVRPESVVYDPPAVPIAADGTPAPGRFRMQGRVPPDARLLRWFYGIVADPYPLVIERADGATYTEWIGGTVWSRPIDLTGQFVPPTRWEIVQQYLVLGYTHILPKGTDHILFVLGLFLLSAHVKPVLLQVTAFTVAHSITLGLSIYGVLSLPPAIVEPLIALSIAYVAVENLVTGRLHAWRVLVVFLFGLLHGLGFAGVLRELGLPRSQFLTALLSFNVGVEIGQLTVIAAAALLLWPALGRDWYRPRVAIPLSIAIALVGLYWTIARTVGS